MDLTFVNLDDDAELELIAGEYDGNLRYYDQGSNGLYTRKTGDDNPFDSCTMNITVTSPTFANLDDDDDLELALGGQGTHGGPSNRGHIDYYDKDDDGDYVEKAGNNNPFNSIDVGWGVQIRPKLADLDGDAPFDLIICSGISNALDHYEENSSGNFIRKDRE